MILRTLLVILFAVTSAAADSITTFSFSGAVEEYRRGEAWDVKGLPYDHGDLVSGSFSYTPGVMSSAATLAFTIGQDAFEIAASAVAWTSWAEGSRVLVYGYSESINAAVGAVFVGAPNILGCFSSAESCSSGIDGRPLPASIDLPRWTMAELQIRQWPRFGTHVFSRNDNQNVFLNAPVTLAAVNQQVALAHAAPLAQTPEPGSLLLLVSGLVMLVVAVRNRWKAK